MKVQRLVAFLSGLLFSSLAIGLIFMRPWLSATESQVQNGYFTYIERKTSITCLPIPWFRVWQVSSQHGESSTQILQIGFFEFEYTEAKNVSPCGTAPIQ